MTTTWERHGFPDDSTDAAYAVARQLVSWFTPSVLQPQLQALRLYVMPDNVRGDAARSPAAAVLPQHRGHPEPRVYYDHHELREPPEMASIYVHELFHWLSWQLLIEQFGEDDLGYYAGDRLPDHQLEVLAVTGEVLTAVPGVPDLACHAVRDPVVARLETLENAGWGLPYEAYRLAHYGRYAAGAGPEKPLPHDAAVLAYHRAVSYYAAPWLDTEPKVAHG